MALPFRCYFAFLLILHLSSVCSSVDPCTNYQLISMAGGHRSSDFYSRESTISICDAYVNPELWHRFEHDAGNRLIEGPVDPWYCGTQAPIWLNGTHPIDATEKLVQVCSSYSIEKMCGWSGTVRIQSCSVSGNTYFVYLLAVPSGCPLAYCVDAASRKQCIPPDIWISDEFRCGVVEETTASTFVSNALTTSAMGHVTEPADPGWSEWGPWSVCSKQCDYGLQSRRRTCGQLPCDGPATMSQLCNEYNCQKIPEEQDKGIAVILKSFDESQESLFKVVESEPMIYKILGNSLNRICSKNASLCCGSNYQGNPIREVEFVTGADIYPAQGALHPKSDGSVFDQIIAVVNEEVDRTVCNADSQRIQARQAKTSAQNFIHFDTMTVAVVDSTDALLQNTGLLVVNYLDPSLIEDYDDDDDDSDCPPTCIVLIVMSCLVVVAVVAIVVGSLCYKMRPRKTDINEPSPPAYTSISYPSESVSRYEPLSHPSQSEGNPRNPTYNWTIYEPQEVNNKNSPGRSSDENGEKLPRGEI